MSVRCAIFYFIGFLWLPAYSVKAQLPEFINESWWEHHIPDLQGYEHESVILLRVSNKSELLVVGDQVMQYKLIHEQLLVHTVDGIERTNRVYLPIRESESSESIRVRVTLPNGTVWEMKPSDIQKEKDEERGVTVHFFAIDGLEQGAVIEKIFVLQENASVKGATVFFQMKVPVLESSFEFIFPSHLEFVSRSYNGLPDIDYVEGAYGKEKNALQITLKNVPSLPEDERYSNEVANEMQLKFKLYKNLANNVSNLNNYSEFSSAFYSGVIAPNEKKAESKLEKYIQKIQRSPNVEHQIRLVEDVVKGSININEYYDRNDHYCDAISSKQARSSELLKLYVNIFRRLGIESEIVITSKRSEVLFDKEFELMNQLNNALLYFPSTKNYLDPESEQYRYPLFNYAYLGTSGLFIKKTVFGGVEMGVGEVRDIGIPEACIVRDTMHILVDMSNDPLNPQVNLNIRTRGYSAMQYQVIKDLAQPDSYELFLNDITENHIEKNKVLTRKVSGEGTAHVGRSPFVLDISCEGSDLVQKAGENYLCNIGVLIGKQMEMYQVNERKLPVEVFFPHYYYRTYEFRLPPGYIIKNPDDFSLHFECGDAENPTAFWDSKLVQDGSVFRAENVEYYSDIVYPLSVFDKYREVVNAAADYNKIVIVVGKNL